MAKIQVDASAGTLITLLKYIYSNKYEVTPESIYNQQREQKRRRKREGKARKDVENR